MANETLIKIEKRIQELKMILLDTGNMRPGSLSTQYRNPAEKKTPFNQISYTYKNKSHSEYVRTENLKTVRNEINTYKQFKLTVEQIIDLSIQASRIRCKANSRGR